MTYRELYKLEIKHDGFRVHKVDRETYEPTGFYDISASPSSKALYCSCFASNKPTCRHRKLVDMYRDDPDAKARIEGGQLWNADKEKWVAPQELT
jgi:hypothetical protein